MKNNKVSYEKARAALATFLLKIQKKDMELVLDDLFTPGEISEFAERITLFKELSLGKTQRDIAQNMGISVTTVNRGSRILKYGVGNISRYL